MVTIVDALDATSLGVAAVAAPSDLKSTRASGNTSYTMISCPASNRFLAIGPPMFPNPMKPIGPSYSSQTMNHYKNKECNDL